MFDLDRGSLTRVISGTFKPDKMTDQELRKLFHRAVNEAHTKKRNESGYICYTGNIS